MSEMRISAENIFGEITVNWCEQEGGNSLWSALESLGHRSKLVEGI